MSLSDRDELSQRFGEGVAVALAAAYASVVHRSTYEQRFATIAALLDEAEAGQTDEDHLREVAQTFMTP